MPENGSVSSGGGASSSSTASSNSSSSSSSSSDNSSNESQTTEQTLSDPPSTGDTLSGGQQASNSNDAGKSTETNTDAHTNGNSDSDKANDNKSGNNNTGIAAANEDSNNVADTGDSGKAEFDNRSSSNNTGSYDEVPSVAVSKYEPTVEVEPAETPPEQTNAPRSLPEGVPNEYAELFGVTPTVVGGVDAVWSNPDGSFSSSDGTTFNPATGEKTYDVNEDSFATTDGVNAEKEKHPDRVRSSESLAVVENDPNNMAKAHGNRAAFDYYNNPNLDSVREQALEQVEARKALAEGVTGDIAEALSNPIDGAIGLAKGMANGVLDLAELVAKGSVTNAAGQQYQAAGFSALFGNDALANKQMQLGDDLLDASKEDLVPSFELDNRAQKGGAVIGTVIDIATGVKGLMTGLGKLGAKNADELTEVATDTATLKQTGGGSQTLQADEMYEAIRASETDVKSIAENTGFKQGNIEKVKDHVFNNEHVLDRYVDLGVPAETRRFDSNINQAEAWNRLENGTHTPEDITWMKHEIAESWYEKKYDSGYSEAHDRVDDRWSGNPWGSE